MVVCDKMHTRVPVPFCLSPESHNHGVILLEWLFAEPVSELDKTTDSILRPVAARSYDTLGRKSILQAGCEIPANGPKNRSGNDSSL